MQTNVLQLQSFRDKCRIEYDESHIKTQVTLT